MKRSTFIKGAALLSTGLLLNPLAKADGILSSVPRPSSRQKEAGRRVGVIGLDSSHSVAFSRLLNEAGPSQTLYNGYRVTAAYPFGGTKIAGNAEKINKFSAEMLNLGIKICNGLEELINQVDCVLLETTDGRMHLQQATTVFKTGKPLFIDKPLGANLEEVKVLYRIAGKYKTKFFSSSALRYIPAIEALKGKGRSALGKIIGAGTFGPCTTEPAHDDLYWYGIHGVEMLFAVMGTGCVSVNALHTADTDLATGIWTGGRIGTFRGTRTGINAFGGTVFGEKANQVLGDFNGYKRLVEEIVTFFETGILPVTEQETKEIYAFMSAFQKSKRTGRQERLKVF